MKEEGSGMTNPGGVFGRARGGFLASQAAGEWLATTSPVPAISYQLITIAAPAASEPRVA